MDEKDEIAKLLEEYQKQKEFRESGQNMPEELAAPKEHIDFAATTDDIPKKEEKAVASISDKETEKILSKKKHEENKNTFLIILNTLKTKLFTKKTALVILGLIIIICAAIGIKYAVGSAKNSYIKSYESKYGVDFPEGIRKEYCDLYGENQSVVGYIIIDDIELDAPVYYEGDGMPCIKRSIEGSITNNFIVTLDTKELEKHYKNAEAYNSSQDFIKYSDLFNNYTFKVIGAFYTNTDPDEDNGYVFPYKTPEEMTVKSASTFATDLETRFLYSTDNLSRKDRLLIITCPTDFRDNFEFVLVCKMTNDMKKSTAKDNDEERIHYPQAVFDEKKLENPYRLANGWYPEIIIELEPDENGEPVTEVRQLSSLDYE